ncbi:MAG: CDP-diacylglycerol--serine O-phosphatidyltransferase [Gemmatimonadetes bacterium]|nr:CDP-diacylglycerol--serine O-phosphatidyltransferase [Gemmatimonadota bacterium]
MIRAPKAPRAALQRGIIILPSAFTIGNLFFGVYAMVSASRGNFGWAAWCIVFAALLDMLDGRVARFTATGSRFGAELDSLVDVVSFGVAPAFIAYQLVFADQQWGWVMSFIYVSATAIRLARFNVEQGGHAKRHFHGLPSPTAGMVLATADPFFTAAGVENVLGGVPSAQAIGILMIVLALLMLSPVPYPLVPRLSIKGARATITSLVLLGCAFTALTIPEYVVFPFLGTYTLWGVTRSTVLGLLDRLPDQDPLLDEEEDEGGAEIRSVDYREIAPERYPVAEDDETPETAGPLL